LYYTSTKVGVRFIRSEEEGLSRLQSDVVEKEHTETANIIRELVVEAQQQRPLLGRQTYM
jgi:hypothetical protein